MIKQIMTVSIVLGAVLALPAYAEANPCLNQSSGSAVLKCYQNGSNGNNGVDQIVQAAQDQFKENFNQNFLKGLPTSPPVPALMPPGIIPPTGKSTSPSTQRIIQPEPKPVLPSKVKYY